MFGTALDSERVFAHDRGVSHRTYVRRRVTMAVLIASSLVALGGQASRALGIGSDEDAKPNIEPAVTRTYVIREGDTLWSIATTIAPGRDPRPVIHELELMNGDAAGPLVPGRVLEVPAVT
jgi:hypothetical protein